MTIDQVRYQFVDDVCAPNEAYLLDAPSGIHLAGLELGHGDPWKRDRSQLWGEYQSQLRQVFPAFEHYLLHAEAIDGISASRRLMLQRTFWAVEMAGAFSQNIQTVCAAGHEFYFGWRKLGPSEDLRSVDGCLSTDRYFLISLGAEHQGSLNELCASGWSLGSGRPMQIPPEITRFLVAIESLSAIPLGRFDDPNYSVISLGQPHLLFGLWREISGGTDAPRVPEDTGHGTGERLSLTSNLMKFGINRFLVGERVRLRSFRGTTHAPVDTRQVDDYWLLVGRLGTVVDTDDVAKIGRHSDGTRVLVQFDREVTDLGLHCHNEVPNAIWVFASDLAGE